MQESNKVANANKFTPQPGDKIICNNGEKFICCTEEFLMSKGYWIHGNEIIFGYSNNPENVTAGVYWNTWNQAGESAGASLSWDIREVIPQNAESSANKKEEVKDEPRYTVEEVTEAFSNALHLSWVGGYKEGIEKVKDYLEKKSDKEYQEYLRLKAIYE